MSSDHRRYPDISDLLAAMAERRKDPLARLRFAEKIELTEALRERLAPLRALHEARRAVRQQTQ